MVHARGAVRRGQDTGCFIDDFIHCVLPYIRPFPEPCSVVMLDNSRYVAGDTAQSLPLGNCQTNSNPRLAACTTTISERWNGWSSKQVGGCTSYHLIRRGSCRSSERSATS